MSYCYDFIKKFKREGNFCGLDKSEVSRLEAYIEIMKTLETHELDEKFIVEMFPLGAARVIIPLKDERRTEGLCFVKEQLLAKKHITAKDLQKKLEISNNSDNKIKSDKLLEISNNKPQRKPEEEKEPQTNESGKSQNGLSTVPKDHPNHGIGCAQPGTVPVSDAPPQPSLAEQVRKEEMAAANANQQQATSAFQTASQFKTQVNGGIAGEMFPAAPVKDSLTTDPATVEPPAVDPVKVLKEKRIRLAKELAACYSDRTQRDIRDLIHENPSWKNEEADAFYFGIEALRNPPKVSAAPARSRA